MEENRAVVVTISDRCSAGDAVDRSGPEIVDCLPKVQASLIHRETIPDEVDRIRAVAERWLGRCELLITTGGTGIADRDVTPEAFGPLIEKPLPGFGEVMRMQAYERLPLSIISRAGAGVARGTLVIWLPGSTRAVRECLEWLAPAIGHCCDFLAGRKPH